MHAKCVHKDNSNIEPLIEEAKANFICKVRGKYHILHTVSFYSKVSGVKKLVKSTMWNVE